MRFNPESRYLYNGLCDNDGDGDSDSDSNGDSDSKSDGDSNGDGDSDSSDSRFSGPTVAGFLRRGLQLLASSSIG